MFASCWVWVAAGTTLLELPGRDLWWGREGVYYVYTLIVVLSSFLGRWVHRAILEDLLIRFGSYGGSW